MNMVRRSFDRLVGTSGLEPPTSRLSGARSNHLSYAPIYNGLRDHPVTENRTTTSSALRSVSADHFSYSKLFELRKTRDSLSCSP